MCSTHFHTQSELVSSFCLWILFISKYCGCTFDVAGWCLFRLNWAFGRIECIAILESRTQLRYLNIRLLLMLMFIFYSNLTHDRAINLISVRLSLIIKINLLPCMKSAVPRVCGNGLMRAHFWTFHGTRCTQQQPISIFVRMRVQRRKRDLKIRGWVK